MTRRVCGWGACFYSQYWFWVRLAGKQPPTPLIQERYLYFRGAGLQQLMFVSKHLLSCCACLAVILI